MSSTSSARPPSVNGWFGMGDLRCMCELVEELVVEMERVMILMLLIKCFWFFGILKYFLCLFCGCY